MPKQHVKTKPIAQKAAFSTAPQDDHRKPPPKNHWNRKLIYSSVLIGSLSLIGSALYSNYSARLGSLKSSTSGDGYKIPKHPSAYFEKLVYRDGTLAASVLQLEQVVDKILTENAYIKRVDAEQVQEVHVAQIASNPQMEDRHSISRFKDTVMLSVHDGHSGHECAESLRLNLHRYIMKALDGNVESIVDAVKSACLQLDNEFIYALLNKKPAQFDKRYISCALSGAVSASVIIHKGQLILAHTGDVRAVLASYEKDQCKVQLATDDHNPEDNIKENKRLKLEHPGEPYVVYSGRVLGGLMPSRAFGDGRYKWTLQEYKKLQSMISSGLLSDSRDRQQILRQLQPPLHYKTPPYVTSEPEVSVHQISPNDKFIIVASDGLWDKLSSEQAVNYIEEYVKSPQTENAASYLTRKALQQVPNDIQPPLLQSGRRMELNEFKSRVTIDLLSLPNGRSRRYRDDITVMVIFLNDCQKSCAASSDELKLEVFQPFKTWTQQMQAERVQQSNL